MDNLMGSGGSVATTGVSRTRRRRAGKRAGRDASQPDLLCKAIVGYIAQNRLGPGDELPGGMALCYQFGVSMRVLREAISRLRVLGILEVRHGSGIYVGSCLPSGGLRHLFSALGSGDFGLLQLLELRFAIEMGNIALAVERVTDSDIEQLRGLVAKMDAAESKADFDQADRQWHLTMLKASGNPLIADIGDVLGEYFFRAATEALRPTLTPEERRWEVQMHGEYTEVLAQRDGQRLWSLFCASLARNRDVVLAHLKGREAEAATDRAEQNDGQPAAANG